MLAGSLEHVLEASVILVPILVAAGVVVVAGAKELAKAVDAARPKPVPVRVPAK